MFMVELDVASRELFGFVFKIAVEVHKISVLFVCLMPGCLQPTPISKYTVLLKLLM